MMPTRPSYEMAQASAGNQGHFSRHNLTLEGGVSYTYESKLNHPDLAWRLSISQDNARLSMAEDYNGKLRQPS